MAELEDKGKAAEAAAKAKVTEAAQAKVTEAEAKRKAAETK